MRIICILAIIFLASCPGKNQRQNQTSEAQKNKNKNVYYAEKNIEEAVVDSGSNTQIDGNNIWPREIPTISKINFKAFPLPPENEIPQKGKIIWVSTSGNDRNDGTQSSPLKSIPKAIEIAGTDTTIVVKGGEYRGNPEDYRAIYIDKNNLKIMAYPGEEVFVRPYNSEQRYGAVIEGDNIIIQGINIDGFLSCGISLGRPEGPTQHNIVIADLRVTFPLNSGQIDGIAVYPDNRASRIPVIDGLLIYNVDVVNPTLLGISCNSGPCINWRIERTRVVLPFVEGGSSGADGIAVEEGRNIFIIDVDIQGAPGDGIDMKAQDVAVFNSYIHNIGRNGIKFWHGGDIVNCLVVRTGSDASLVFDSGGVYRVLNSTIVEHNYRGLSSYVMTLGYDQADQPAQLIIANSIFYRHSGGFFISRSTKAQFINNIFGQFGGDTLITIGTDNPENPTTLGNNQNGVNLITKMKIGRGNLFNVDPGFVNMDSKNYTISPQSKVAIDAGAVIDIFPSFDRHGNKRIKGKAPDLGPDEIR